MWDLFEHYIEMSVFEGHSADAMLADKAVEFLVDANVFSCFLRDINGKVGLLV